MSRWTHPNTPQHTLIPENALNQSINLFRFPEIHLQGCYHMDMEIVKNIIQIPSNMIKNNEQYYIQE